MNISRTPTAVLLLALALAMPGAGRAEPVPVDSIIKFSDAIVVGRLTIVDLDSTKTVEKGKGYVRVEEVVAGPVEAGEKVPYEWHVRFDLGIICPAPFRYKPLEGVLGVWFLERGKDGVLRPNGEIWDLENLQSLEYSATVLRWMEPTERTSLLQSLVERQARALENR